MRYLFLIIFIFLTVYSTAQLTAPGRNAVRYTSYHYAPAIKDSIFIYCNASGSQKGALQAVSPEGAGIFNFSWYQWDDNTKSFSFALKSESGVTTSSLTDLNEGGYKVNISGDSDTSFVGWIFFDTPPVAEASLQQQLCYRVALKGKAEATVANFYYRDPSDGSQISLKNETKFLWSSFPLSYIPGPEATIDPIIENYPPDPPYIEYRLPLIDLTYNLRVNSLGCSSEASFPYESIHVRADFTFEPAKGEAPLKVTFTDKSIRASVYKWKFGDNRDSVSELSNPAPHTYYKPGKYYVKLAVESELHCIDSIRSDSIVVEPSKLGIPNVFTPDGDGINDYFMVELRSLRFISMEVFSRSGKKVYNFFGEGESLREWKGWDGNVNNSSIKASPGVYFYIIQAYGWDDIEYNSKKQRGFVYLYR